MFTVVIQRSTNLSRFQGGGEKKERFARKKTRRNTIPTDFLSNGVIFFFHDEEEEEEKGGIVLNVGYIHLEERKERTFVFARKKTPISNKIPNRFSLQRFLRF